MKKILLSTAALAGLAFAAATPVRADEPALQLGVGGYVSGYAMYTDQDETGATDNMRSFDFRKDTEVHLNGEVALDNGITAGAHLELLMDGADDANTVEESYMYLSSSWGRINFGEEDGVAYLLQVAAPSADDKVDGIRPDVGTFNVANLGGTASGSGTLDYAQDDSGYANKFTYITPVFNGFQAGVSFTPSADGTFGDGPVGSTAGASQDDQADQFENGLEIAARYEGSFESLDVAIGAGYGKASLENEAASTFTDDLQTWNAGANVGWGAFGLGVAYLTTNNANNNNGDTDTLVAGVDYTTGPYKLGVSYLNQETETGPLTGVEDEEVERWTAGAIYEWGPGMTFRGSVQFQSADNVDGTAAADRDGTQVAVGTQLNF
jgi:outer membrane protein OmpU